MMVVSESGLLKRRSRPPAPDLRDLRSDCCLIYFFTYKSKLTLRWCKCNDTIPYLPLGIRDQFSLTTFLSIIPEKLDLFTISLLVFCIVMISSDWVADRIWTLLWSSNRLAFKNFQIYGIYGCRVKLLQIDSCSSIFVNAIKPYLYLYSISIDNNRLLKKINRVYF